MLTTAGRDLFLNQFDSHFCALVTSITDWRAGTFVEASYTGYSPTARPGITFGAAAATTPAGGRQRGNSVAVAFPQNTGGDVAIIGWAAMSATSGGAARAFGLLDADSPIFGTALVTDLITAPGHGLSAGQRVFVLAAPGAVLPAGLAENTAYYVTTANLTADVFSLSASGAGGAVVDITAVGAALFMPYVSQTIAANSTPNFAIGQLVAQL